MLLNYEPIYSINRDLFNVKKAEKSTKPIRSALKSLKYIFAHKLSFSKKKQKKPIFLSFKITLHLKEINIVKKWI